VKGVNEREAREQEIIANADYFTVVQQQGRAKGYSRTEVPSIEEAESKAKQLVEVTGRSALIYAVMGVHDTFVKGVEPERVQPKKGSSNDGKGSTKGGRDQRRR
jgi:hypothetical protein